LAARGSEGPRVRVAALTLVDGQVVTVRHRAGDAVYHLLPGGGVRYRETLEESLLREVLEETGLMVRIGPPVLLSDTIDPKGRRHLVNITFAAEVIGGSITDQPLDERVEAVDLVDPATLRDLDLRPPIADALIEWLDAGQDAPARYLGPLFTLGSR